MEFWCFLHTSTVPTQTGNWEKAKPNASPWSCCVLVMVVAIVADRRSHWSVNEESGWAGLTPCRHFGMHTTATPSPPQHSFCTKTVSVRIVSSCWGTTMSDTHGLPPSTLPCPHLPPDKCAFHCTAGPHLRSPLPWVKQMKILQTRLVTASWLT